MVEEALAAPPTETQRRSDARWRDDGLPYPIVRPLWPLSYSDFAPCSHVNVRQVMDG